MDEIRKELDGIISSLDGRNLSPADVVDYARKNKESATHAWLEKKGCFDQKQAAANFALLIARDLIRRVTVVVEARDDSPIKTRAYVSLDTDRAGDGGYRPVRDVLGAADLRADYLKTALRELESLRLKYRHVKELEEVWESIANVSVPA